MIMLSFRPLLALGFLTAFVFPAAAAPGDIDSSFSPPLLLTGGIDAVKTAVLRPDQSIVGGGDLEEIGGDLLREDFFVLSTDGTIEAGVVNPNPGGLVTCVAVLPDGSMIVGGNLNDVGGNVDQDDLVRLFPDGSLDLSFNAPDGLGAINAIALLSDGSIYVGGFFTDVAGDTARDYLVRLNRDGSLDTGFNPPTPNGAVYTIQVLPEGLLLVGGVFTDLGSEPSPDCLVRLDGDGLIDPLFVPPVLNGGVYSLFPQPDGKILVGGGFINVEGESARDGLIRLGADGVLDSTFNPPALNGIPFCITLQVDGKVLLAGEFSDVGGDPARDYLVRLEGTGTVDGGFNSASFDDSVESIQIDALGRIIAGGRFINFDGQSALDYLVRLENDEVVDALEVVDNATLRWTRGGALQEAARVNFQLSTDGGISWTDLGEGVRQGVDWEIGGLSLPESGLVRGLAILPGGRFVGSSGIVASQQSFAFSTPVITITGSSKLSTTKRRLTLKGTASDADGDLSRVEFRDSREKGKRWREASGTTRWKAKVTLKTGRNKIQIRAYDERGAISAIKKVTVKKA